MAERERVTCPTCGRSVVVRWRDDNGYVGLYAHRASPTRPADPSGGGWCSPEAFRPRCPIHDMPDCSPLLNGCSELTGVGG